MGVNRMTTERTSTELFRFGLGFLGFLLTAAGLVLVKAGLAIFGALLLLIIVLSFGLADGD
jgi:hypothetical protein